MPPFQKEGKIVNLIYNERLLIDEIKERVKKNM